MATHSNLEQHFSTITADAVAPVPVSALHRFLFGSIDPKTGKDAPGHAYTPDEIETVLKLAVEQRAAAGQISRYQGKKLWITSAGGPGAGKSTALLQWVAQLFEIKVPDDYWHEASLSEAIKLIFSEIPAIFISPDRGGLLSLAQCLRGTPTSDEAFYLKWRWASNFLSGLATNLAKTRDLSAVHDTTLSSEAGLKNLEQAKKDGRYIAALLQGAPLDTREEAAHRRNVINGFYQSLPANVIDQDRSFAKNLPRIVGLADQVVIGWRDGVGNTAQHVAKIFDGKTLVVLNEKGFQNYCVLYPEMAELTRSMERKAARDVYDPLPDLVAAMMRDQYPGSWSKPVRKLRTATRRIMQAARAAFGS